MSAFRVMTVDMLGKDPLDVCMARATISDGTQVPDLCLKPGFFPFEWVGFFSLKTRVPGFPIFKILRPKNEQISTKNHQFWSNLYKTHQFSGEKKF